MVNIILCRDQGINKGRWRAMPKARGRPVLEAIRPPVVSNARAPRRLSGKPGTRGYLTPTEARYSLFFQLTPVPVKCL